MTLHLAKAATALRACTPAAGDNEFGSVELQPDDQVVAGGRVALELIYTAGLFGIDDSGALRVTFRYASDMANPQFSEPGAADYVSAEASNGAVRTPFASKWSTPCRNSSLRCKSERCRCAGWPQLPQ